MTMWFVPVLGVLSGLIRPVFSQDAGLNVDLGYGTHRGYHNDSIGLNIWKGIRYAAAPVGALRWQAPSPPEPTEGVIQADEFGPSCPQANPYLPTSGAVFVPGDEDCLFLNVYSPSDASEENRLPVFISIHGGGYGAGNGMTDMTDFMATNDNSFVSVTIQYRLGAFGFLSSADIKERGVLNAGLLDQRLAFQWVQDHISKFGGDPDKVTIAGESAGGGSVLLHSIAEDGGLGTSLFKNIIAASPWVPTQPRYDDDTPSLHYRRLAEAVGCGDTDAFDCLVAADSLELQRAANEVSSSEPTFYGYWAFTPVTDDAYITGPPSVLRSELKGRLSGERILVGINANEGALLTPHDIQTQDDLVEWIEGILVNLSSQNISRLLEVYASTEEPVDPEAPRFETNGLESPTAVNVSQLATGQQQRAYNIGAEGSVNCVGYWLASAFTGENKEAWYYQYSVPFALHGKDLAAYYGPPTVNQGPDLVTAFRRIYGNFITADNPSISNGIANGASAEEPDAPHPASEWPRWDDEEHLMLNLNQTGGVPYMTYGINGAQIMEFMDPGLRNDFAVVDAYAWEGERGERCEFWRDVGPLLPL